WLSFQYGSTQPFGDYTETWEYDGITWTQAMPATSPPPLSSLNMVFDERRGRCVLCAGPRAISSTGNLLQTWEWDGVNWLRMTSATTPTNVYLFSLAYDSVRGRTVCFGGCTDSGSQSATNQTWEWDGSAWTQRLPAVSPPPRFGQAMAFDRARGRLVMHGG